MPSKIVTSFFEPITAKKLMSGMTARSEKQKAKHAPTLDAPDYDHPLVKTLVEQMPKMENRQMVNSLLSHAGMPQIGPRASKPQSSIQGRLMPSQWRRQNEIQDRKNAADAANA